MQGLASVSPVSEHKEELAFCTAWGPAENKKRAGQHAAASESPQYSGQTTEGARDYKLLKKETSKSL